MPMWDVPCVRETYDEDNDTEEESEDEEEAKERSRELDMLSTLLTDRKATVKDLRKGFIFFMDSEKKDLKRHDAIQKALRLQRKTYEVDEITNNAPKEWWED